jgi:hypothetical protein
MDLAGLTTHGQAQTKFTGGVLDVWTTRSITGYMFNLRSDTIRRHYISLPKNYRLPFRVDMTVKLDHPSFLLLLGKGHITFSSPWQDNRKIEGLAFPSGKPNQDKYSYNNRFPLGEWIGISIICNVDELQILIDGQERFYSRKLAYMSKKRREELDALNTDGFALGLAVSKRSTLAVKSITVTEYDERAPVERGGFAEIRQPAVRNERSKPTFESVLAELPREFYDEAVETDNFLRSLRPMKFKRSIDKNGGKVSWVASDYGVSYHILPSGDQLSHRFSWYVVETGTPDTWHRKANRLAEMLDEIATSDPGLAGRLFYALDDCVGCNSEHCGAKRLYAFNGEKRLACHGMVMLQMSHDDFRDARAFFRHLNAQMAKKGKDGVSTEKIYLFPKSSSAD